MKTRKDIYGKGVPSDWMIWAAILTGFLFLYSDKSVSYKTIAYLIVNVGFYVWSYIYCRVMERRGKNYQNDK